MVISGTGPVIRRFSGRALVLDDEALVRRICERYLAALGLDVQVAAHGREALELARRAVEEGHPFRVALLDLTVEGGLGGAQIAEELRQASPGIRLIVSSGYRRGDDARNDWDGRLQKPFTLTEMERTLDDVLGPST